MKPQDSLTSHNRGMNRMLICLLHKQLLRHRGTEPKKASFTDKRLLALTHGKSMLVHFVKTDRRGDVCPAICDPSMYVYVHMYVYLYVYMYV